MVYMDLIWLHVEAFLSNMRHSVKMFGWVLLWKTLVWLMCSVLQASSRFPVNTANKFWLFNGLISLYCLTW